MADKIDLLNRGEFVDNVLNVVNQLSKNKKGCCFAVEGSWGIGKTFVIEEMEKQLRLIQSNETNSHKYFVFHYNCWQHDYYEEPAVAIVSAMITSIQEEENVLSEDATDTIRAGFKFAKEKLNEIAGLYIENKIGINLIDWAKQVGEEKKGSQEARHAFDKLFNFGQTIENVRKKLKEIAEEKTLVLVVDELDRCIPQYAIKVLERIHHIFYGMDNVVVIMAIDRNQLEHTVEEMFGIRKDEDSIDVEKYLKKFIDFSMVLDNGIINEQFEEKYKFFFEKFQGTQEDKEKVIDILVALFDGIDIRRQEKIIEKANVVHSLICNKVVDISLLGFEIMYEIFNVWYFNDLNVITRINENHYINVEQAIGGKRLKLLEELESEASKSFTGVDFNNRVIKKKIVNNNLCGKIFWYFSEIFCEQVDKYEYNSPTMSVIEDELEMAFKYCEYREIIQ